MPLPQPMAKALPELFGHDTCFYGQHVVSADQFDPASLEQLLNAARHMNAFGSSLSGSLAGKTLATVFYQESTRTRLSFEAAMHSLGGSVISTVDAKTFSAAKGETLEDTVSVISGYCHVLLLRHTDVGSAQRATEYSTVPLINGGDGPGEHPTQALVDLYTIWTRMERLEGLKIAVVGDLAQGRTVHSLLKTLSLYSGNTAFCVSDPELALPTELADIVEQRGLELVQSQNLQSAVRSADVVYMTRTQVNLYADRVKNELEAEGKGEAAVKRIVAQRVREFEKRTRGRYVLTADMLPGDREVWIMHPLPRREEIPTNLDSYVGSIYIEQARSGAMDVRRALLAMILGI